MASIESFDEDIESDFARFRAAVPRQTRPVGAKNMEWHYYDSASMTKSFSSPSKATESSPQALPLVCLHGTAGTAEVFFNQILSLNARGFRVISAQYPAYSTVDDWVEGFQFFLDALGLRRIHLLGNSLGGYLALWFVKQHGIGPTGGPGGIPARVQSLILCHAFHDTSVFAANSSCLSMLPYMPEFYLRKYLLDNFPKGDLPAHIADSIDFVVTRMDSLTRDDLAARLTLNATKGRVRIPETFPSQLATIIDTFDPVALPESMRKSLWDLLPDAKFAFLKDGGDFPFLSVPEEFTMHCQIHLRAHDVDPIQQVRLHVHDEEIAEEEKDFFGAGEAGALEEFSGEEEEENVAGAQEETATNASVEAKEHVLTPEEEEEQQRKRQEKEAKQRELLAGLGVAKASVDATEDGGLFGGSLTTQSSVFDD